MAATQKGAIAFGLVYIPVELYTAVQNNDISFNQLSSKTGNRIRYKKIDAGTGNEIEQKEIVRGFQYEKDRYVVISDEDIEKIKTEKDRSIQVMQTVDICSISPAYYNRSYYVVPQKGGEKAFNLLRTALLEAGQMAVGKTVMGTKETSLILVPADDAILLVTLFYEEEIKDLPKVSAQPKLTKAELDMAKQLLQSMSAEFKPEEFRDEYQEKLRALIESKIEGKEIVVEQSSEIGQITNLMDALKASLEATRSKKPAKGKTSARKKVKEPA